MTIKITVIYREKIVEKKADADYGWGVGTREPLAFETQLLTKIKGLGDRDLPVSESSRRIVVRSIRRSVVEE